MAAYPAALIHDWAQDKRKQDPQWRFWPTIGCWTLRILGWGLVIIGFIAFPIAFLVWACITFYQLEKEDVLRRLERMRSSPRSHE